MSDIVERLRGPVPEGTPLDQCRFMSDQCGEAADELERLTLALQEIIAECGGYTLENDVAFRVASIARRALEPKP